ncbi:hypothetical protein [Agromyces silvae]|uniref:hypothetical protein n=1 Tax=Agromyces silvae TaxID=3388266 RepID=UPI00280B2EA3|nr:hypothetical protein [Agromyces protaetiae]
MSTSESTPPRGAARRLRERARTARFFEVSESTVDNWHSRGYIVAYRRGAGELLFDLDEIEEKLSTMPRSKMRDGRLRGKGRVVALPIVAEVATEADQ